MRSPHKSITTRIVLLSFILVMSIASATADNHSTRVFNADNYPLPVLQFDASQEKVVVSEEFSLVIAEAGTLNDLKRTTVKSIGSSTVPNGAIIYYAEDGVTTVFDQTGQQLFAADDALAAMIPTPVGMIPATHVCTVPSGSYAYYSENVTYIINNNEIVLVKLYEKTRMDDNSSIIRSSEGSSAGEQKNLKSYAVETDQINSTLMAYAGIDNPGFYPGQNFTVQWIVPDPPLQPGTLSPTYVSIGLDEMNSYHGYTTWRNFRPIIEYDYDQNAWLMSACSYDRYNIMEAWEALCTNKFLIYSGDKIEGRIEYSEDTGSSPPRHQFNAFTGDYNTGLGISSGSRFPFDTDTISQLNINLQGDVANMNESTIIGNVTFAPVNLPASPTTYVNLSNSQLPHLNIENLWPDKIIFHTLEEPGAEGYTFSTTEVLEPPNASYQSAGFITSQNVEQWLSDKAGWKLLFNKSWANVTKADFGSDGSGLNNATLHWHVGHGGTFDDGTSYLGLQDYPNSNLPASVVEKKWGGKNK